MSPATHVAPEPQVQPTGADRQLGDIDEELARQAEETLRLGMGEGSFELEGEFLSQDEIAQVMAAEAQVPAKPSAVEESPAEPDTTPTESRPVESGQQPAVLLGSDGGEMFDPEVVALSPLADPATGSTLPEPAVDPLPAVESQLAESPLAGPQTDPAPAAGPVAVVDDIESLIAGQSTPPAAAAPAQPVDDLASQPELDIGGNELLESVAVPISVLPMPGWQRTIASIASVLDRPWASLSRRAKNVVGIIGAVLLLIGVVLWTMGPVEIPRRAAAELPPAASPDDGQEEDSTTTLTKDH